jgi:hypothetical protein
MCDQVIDETDTPAEPMTVVLGAVALPASTAMPHALQATRVRTAETGVAYFAKWGLQVRRDTHVELSVPPRAAGRLWIGWGNAAEPSDRVVVDRCPGPQRWVVFVGGYWVRTPGCFELLVSVNGSRQQTVRIGIGAPCPGQSASVSVGKEITSDDRVTLAIRPRRASRRQSPLVATP